MTIEQAKVPIAGSEVVSVAQPRGRLQGSMGVFELVMSVLAFSAPLTTTAGFIPVLLTYSGASAPSIYLMVTVLLLIFAVGFVAMARSVPNPGGFYAFVTAGLGRSAGLGSAFLALFGYLAIGFFGPAFFAITLKGFLEPTFGFPEISWYWYGLGLVVLTTALAYRRIDLSAKVLTTVMALEIIAVIVFEVAAFIHGGPADGGGAGFTLPSTSDGALGLAVLFVVANFLGFEATVIYREEVKDPAKTIPRAVYGAVGGVGVFYAITAWAFVAYFGADKSAGAAQADTPNLFSSALTSLVGHIVYDIVAVLLISSVVAAMLSIQNASARYLFSLGSDNVLPSVLGKVHRQHKSPYVAATMVGVLWATLVVVFTVTSTAPEGLYPKAVGVGTLAIIVEMLVASIAVLGYFLRRSTALAGLTIWQTTVAPCIATLGLGAVTYLAVANFSELLGESGIVSTVFVILTFSLPVAGFAYARILRRRRHEIYDRIGRQAF
ncbi:APC family permease [Nocardia rhamnosiphila]|uniref:APC family permease n=1 Tax=Nocardia rhamnosiphila TaxID=426716 RepID=A0ABV2WRF5_9NOCA